MITADQILCHLVGDYVLQSDWMANEKTKRHLPALLHACAYCVPFLFLRPSFLALVLMASTHFFIDRYRLARYVVWAKNFQAPFHANPPWRECMATGYPPERPAWLSVWLLIILDNVLHLAVNGAALRWL